MESDTKAPERLIASDRVEGTAVYNKEDERLGSIERFMVDKASGQVEYAVMGFGGLFGLATRHYPLPWNALTYDTNRGGYIVNLSRDQLAEAPSYDPEAETPTYDRSYGERIYGYYGFTYL
ncbi:PRC-barrel domain-containing protein [Sphingomonas sp. LB-2]|uniref:PRC-barrel domain-containing protein n=1 Tax=Sphingomonas caeni TaxID=2984949 RepID=UPI0022305B97|nr:PRC-barrel domain-containing protein [Sphingomonas caeni]MCW3847789.1 PRC-barrel domain-containing protein [Sphingomonas caeni]